MIIKIPKSQIKLWKKNRDIRAVVACRNCGEIHEIRNQFRHYYCDCGKALIWFYLINYLWAKPVYKSVNLKNDNLRTYDKWK